MDWGNWRIIQLLNWSLNKAQTEIKKEHAIEQIFLWGAPTLGNCTVGPSSCVPFGKQIKVQTVLMKKCLCHVWHFHKLRQPYSTFKSRVNICLCPVLEKTSPSEFRGKVASLWNGFPYKSWCRHQSASIKNCEASFFYRMIQNAFYKCQPTGPKK